MEKYKNPDKIKTVTLSKNIENVSSHCFRDLKNLETIKVDDKNPLYYAEDGILFYHYKKTTQIIFYPANKAGTSYRFPSKVTSVDKAFTNNRNLKTIALSSNMLSTGIIGGENNIETIIIPSKVKYVEEQSFRNCKKLKKVVMGRDIMRICDEAFYGCSSLETIILPKKLERIDRWAFRNCKSIKKLTIPSSVHYIEPSAFSGCRPSVKREAYLRRQKNGSYVAKAPVNVNGKKKEYKAKNITKIRATDKTITLKKGQKKKIKTSVYISGKKKGILDYSMLRYTSSNNKVAKVTSHGNIKALKKGKVTIRVSLRNKDMSYKITVRVK